MRDFSTSFKFFFRFSSSLNEFIENVKVWPIFCSHGLCIYNRGVYWIIILYTDALKLKSFPFPKIYFSFLFSFFLLKILYFRLKIKTWLVKKDVFRNSSSCSRRFKYILQSISSSNNCSFHFHIFYRASIFPCRQ